MGKLDPSSLSDEIILAEKTAAIIHCYRQYGDQNPYVLSQKISEVRGIPCVISNIADLPYRRLHRRAAHILTSRNAKHLGKLAWKTHPDALDIWRTVDFYNIAAIHGANCTTIRRITDNPITPFRLNGTKHPILSVITLPDRHKDIWDHWSDISGIPKAKIEKAPIGNKILNFTIAHEIGGHTLQAYDPKLPYNYWYWQAENDADSAALVGMERYERKYGNSEMANLEETLYAIVQARTIGAFLLNMPTNWSALTWSDLPNPTYAQSFAVGHELRLRAYIEATGEDLPQSDFSKRIVDMSSQEVQQLISMYFTDKIMCEVKSQLVAAADKPFTPNHARCILDRIDVWAEHPLTQKVRLLLANNKYPDPKASAEEAAVYTAENLQLKTRLNTVFEEWKRERTLTGGGFNYLEKMFFQPALWLQKLDIDVYVPALHRVMSKGQITDVAAKTNAQMIVDAAIYFRPSLKAKLGTPYSRPARVDYTPSASTPAASAAYELA
jgi:hypothetical protein